MATSTLVEAIQSALETAGVASATALNWPGETATATKITPYASSAHPSLKTGIQRVQVMSRAASYATAESESWKAYKALVDIRGKGGTAWGDRDVFNIRPLQEPFFLGRDERGRYVVEFNIEIEAGWTS